MRLQNAVTNCDVLCFIHTFLPVLDYEENIFFN